MVELKYSLELLKVQLMAIVLAVLLYSVVSFFVESVRGVYLNETWSDRKNQMDEKV